MQRKTNPGDDAEQVRVLRVHLATNTVGDYGAPYVFNKMAARNYRHRDTKVTPDGTWAVVTMVKNDIDDEENDDDWKG
jgi:hypothetical protein